MELQELKAKIKTKDIPNFLIFTGDEYAVQKIYVDQIAKVCALSVKYIDSATEVLNQIGSKSFINQHYCYVVRDDKELMTNEKLQALLTSKLKSDIFILLISSVDKRLKFYKTYNKSFIEFKPLAAAVLKKYIQKEIELSDKNCDRLIEVCEGNYGRILLEIDKIERYSDSNPTLIRNIYDNGFEMLLNDGTIYQPPKDAIFDLVKAILQNKPALAFDLLQNCKEVGESSLAILSVLFNNTKQVLQVQTYKGDNVEKTTGMSYWQIKNAKECSGYYSDNNLVYMMRLIQSVERRIKTGEIEEAIAVDYVLSNIL